MQRIVAVLLALQLAACSFFAVGSRPEYDTAVKRWKCTEARSYALIDAVAGTVLLVGGISALVYHEHCDGCSDQILLLVPVGVLLGMTDEVSAVNGIIKGRTCRRRLSELRDVREP